MKIQAALRSRSTVRPILTSLLGIISLAAQVFADSVPEVLHYKFNGTGTSVPNLASNPPAGTATATIMGGLSQTGTDLNTGGGGFSLLGSGNSSSTDYLDTGWAPNLGNGSWTISFVSSNFASSSTLFYVFGDFGTANFRCFTNGIAGANNWILRGAGLTDVYINGGATVATHRNTFVYDNVANNVKAYLDGVLVSTVAQTAPNLTGTGPLKVMGYSTNVGAPAGGLLDDFRIYSRALSAAEVASIDVGPEIVVEDAMGTPFQDGTGSHTFGSAKALSPRTNSTTFTIRNTGNESLTGLSVTIDGADSSQFIVGALPADSVTGGSSISFSVTFRPTSAGVKNAAIHVLSNDEDESSFDISLTGTGTTITTAVSNITLASGAPAPGAGTNGLPAGTGADAPVITSFNTPATDDDGSIAYLAKWKTPTARGTGLFLNDKCLAVVGGNAPIAGAKWVSFTDPVVHGGTVVAIAKLAGSPKPPASVIVISNANGSLDIFARTGDIAPLPDGTQPAGAPLFKTFKAATLHRGSVGFLAQLTGGTGAQKTTAANDWGIWLKDGASPLERLYREGQTINGKTIKTLISFMPGADSPGQGRGWVTRASSVGIGMALAHMTDKSQAILTADSAGNTFFYAQTGTIGGNGSPSTPNTTFASFGLPATNDNDATVFLASLKVGAGGVTSANARGIFRGVFSGPCTPLARIGDAAGATGAKFTKLGDPIISADNDIAFTATIKGGTVKGLGAQTLWWANETTPPTLIAQGGTRPGTDFPPEAQWKSFTSLAISDDANGIILAGTLVPNKGGVTAANASGVWAFDIDRNPRLLFRTGTTIGGKTLKSFTLLKATVGSTGVTRSTDSFTGVVWLATFTDKTTAIVRTQVP